MDSALQFYAKDRQAWRQWLVENHQTQQSVWLVYDKGSQRSMSWQDIVQEALCFGWIDSRPGKVSETQSKIYVSKRKPKSVWSKINKESIEMLTAKGLMSDTGLKAVEIARVNGSWDTLNNSDNLVIPAELDERFATLPESRANFEKFPPSSRRSVLQWIYDAKTPETRQQRVDQVADAASRNERLR